MKTADFSIKHPAIIIILLITALLFGVISLLSLKQDMLSEMSLPTVAIITVYPGVGPEDIEREVTNVLEDEISTLSGIENISSNSQDSSSVVQVEFDWGTDVDTRISELREKINNVLDDLPDGIEGPPVILKLSVDLLPILSVQVEGEMSRDRLTDFIEDRVIPAVSQVEGVSTVKLQGGRERIVDIEIQSHLLEAKNISILDVYQALGRYNMSFPAGSVLFRNRELKMRTVGEYRSLKEIEDTVVGFADSTTISLKDIARIRFADEEPEVHAISGSDQVIVLDVMKQQGADTNLIVEEVKRNLENIEEEHAGLLRFNIIADQSIDIKLAINSVRSAAVLGGLLAVVILFVFLHNVRSTFIISFSIPVSVLLAFIALKLNGQSLNLMTLGGLTVGIGMIVDSSIVVLENIHRHYAAGMGRKEAASLGTAEVGGAIVASTSTTLSVFLPLLFVQGFAGTILRDTAYTIVYALTAALIVSIIVVPFLSAHIMAEHFERKKRGLFPGISRGIEKIVEKLTAAYKRALISALHSRVFVLLTAVSVLALSFLAFDFLGFEFVPETDMNEIQMDIETPAGFSLDMTLERTREIEALVDRLVPEIETSLYYVGQGDPYGFSKSINIAFGRLRLISSKERERSVFQIIELLRREIPAKVPDISINIVNGGLGAMAAMATGGQGFMIEVYGSTMDDLVRAASQVEQYMMSDPNVAKTEINVSFNRQEIVSDLNLDYMGQLGVTPYQAAISSRIVFNGINTGVFRTEGESYDMFLNSEFAGNKVDEDVLNRIAIRSVSGNLISLSSVANFRVEPSISNINHEDKMKSIIVTGYLHDPDVRDTLDRISQKIEENPLPIGVDWNVGGSTAEMAASFESLLFSMLIAVFLVYAVMVIQFERFVQPLIVMAAVPFTFIGVVAGLSIFGSTLSIVSFLGIIALAGIVVNNAIVMIDYTNLIRKRDGLDLFEAVVEGAASRLKPILMTTLTTVLGIIPMALGIGEGAEIYSPLGQSIAGGLLTSTLITLFLVPVLYYLVEIRRHRSTAPRPAKN